jgi:hypothetical protein
MTIGKRYDHSVSLVAFEGKLVTYKEPPAEFDRVWEKHDRKLQRLLMLHPEALGMSVRWDNAGKEALVIIWDETIPEKFERILLPIGGCND